MQSLSARALKEQNMIYRYLGNTGLKVSIIGFGNWLTGHDSKMLETQTEIIKYCWD
jgi:aryl-alcohol dehydrogenase-like predicted oxidoreductase